MTSDEKKAFAEACKDWAVKSAGKDLGEYFWNAALEHAAQRSDAFVYMSPNFETLSLELRALKQEPPK